MAQAATVIAAGTTISGRIEGAEDVTVLGTVKGTVQLEGALLVDEAARVEADCAVSDLEVHGILVGNVTASESVELHKTARVIGDLVAPRVIVHEGALFRGLIDMGEPAEGSEAPARGARRSKPAARTTSRRKPAARRAAPKAAAEAPAADEAPAKAATKPAAKAKAAEQ